MAKAVLIDGWNETEIAGVQILAEGGLPKRVSVRGKAFMVDPPGSAESKFDHDGCDAFLATYGARVVSHDLWGAGEGEDESVCTLEAFVPSEISSELKTGIAQLTAAADAIVDREES